MKKLITLVLLFAASAAAAKVPGLGPDDSGPMKVAEDIQKLRLVDQVKPVYPELARISRTEGSVVLQIIVNKEGSVTKVEIVSGPALLTRAAADAVKGWKYKPTIVNGTAVEVSSQVHIHFSMK